MYLAVTLTFLLVICVFWGHFSIYSLAEIRVAGWRQKIITAK